MARRQDNNKRKDKWTALFRRARLWGSGSTGKHAIKLLKTQKRRSQLQWYIYIYILYIYIYIYIYIYKYALKIGPRN